MELNPFYITPAVAQTIPTDPFRNKVQPPAPSLAKPPSTSEASMNNFFHMVGLMGPLLPEDNSLCQEAFPHGSSQIDDAAPQVESCVSCPTTMAGGSSRPPIQDETGRYNREDAVFSHQFDLEAVLGGPVDPRSTSAPPFNCTNSCSPTLDGHQSNLTVSTEPTLTESIPQDFHKVTGLRSPAAKTVLSNEFLGTATIQNKGMLQFPPFVPRVTAAPTEAPIPYPCSPVTPPPRASSNVPTLPLLALRPAPSPSPPLTPRSVLATESAGFHSSASPKRAARKPKTYMKPVASRFCHICSRMPRRGQGSAVCRNMKRGLCRKIVCERCVLEQGWNFKAIIADKDSWLCPHCLHICPARSQCHIYNKINARRKRCGEEAGDESKRHNLSPEKKLISIEPGDREMGISAADANAPVSLPATGYGIEDSLVRAKEAAETLTGPYSYLVDAGEF